jgi:hypothetical protein
MAKPTFVVYYGFAFFGSFLSSLMSNSAAVALMLPITLPMAELMEMSPQSVAMLAPMTTSFIMLVIGCPPTIIAYSTGYFSQKEFHQDRRALVPDPAAGLHRVHDVLLAPDRFRLTGRWTVPPCGSASA